MTKFQQWWHEVRERQGSNVVAGLDPAHFALGRGEAGLPEDVDLQIWSEAFIDAVAPSVAAVKLNIGYFMSMEAHAVLPDLITRIHGHGLLAISDNKVADIGTTNGAWFFDTKQLGFDAVTCAPYAGNIESSIALAHEADLPIIMMGLMSNPEYQSEMNFQDLQTGETLWHSRVRRSLEAGADGIVVGGTYTTADSAFMDLVTLTKDTDMLYLIPGIGQQGGEVEQFLASGIDPARCMVSSSRGVMFPNGSGSIPDEQAAAASALRDQFNQVIV